MVLATLEAQNSQQEVGFRVLSFIIFYAKIFAHICSDFHMHIRLPRFIRFYAKHFKMTLVSSTSDSSSDSDGADIDYNSPDASPDILTTQAPLDLSRRHSAEKKTMMWKQVGSKILSAVRVKGVGSSARNTAGVLRSLDERPILSPKAKKTRGYRTQTSKRASSSRSRASSEPGSSSLAVMSFSSDESGEDQEIEMKVAPFDGARSDQRSSSSSGLALPIKTLKTAGGLCLQLSSCAVCSI